MAVLPVLGLLVGVCDASGEHPTTDASPSISPAMEPPVPAQSATTGSPASPSYDRVRADPRLGPALENDLFPALRTTKPVANRIADFQAARKTALAVFEAAVQAGQPVATPEEAAQVVEGPPPAKTVVRDAFDQVCTDALHAFLLAEAHAIAESGRSADDRATELTALAGLAKDSMPWAKGEASGVRVDILLLRQSIVDSAAP